MNDFFISPVDIVNNLLRICGQYDMRGLKYTVDHLKQIFPEIIFYPIQQQAKYADIITVKNCKNLAFAKAQAEFINFTKEHQLNSTEVGNAAYMVLNSDDITVKNTFKNFLDLLKDEYRK